MDQIITTGAERAQAAATDEPLLTLTQLQSLLREAAAVERAQRPIVLHTAPQPFTVIDSRTAPDWQPAPQGPDFHGRYPSPAEYAGVVPMAPLKPGVVVRHWGKPLGLAGVAAMVSGAGAGVVTGTAVAPIAAILAGLLAIAGGVVRGEVEMKQEAAR